MKRIIAFAGIIVTLLLLPVTPAYADSPLTSTPFSKAYSDIDLVVEAGEAGVINPDIAAYLEDANNPIDVKAAIMNALSWGPDNKNNAEEYSILVFGVPIDELNKDELSGDQLFCIGYMLALDHYNDPKPALDYLLLAEEKLPGSITVSMIRALTESMDIFSGSWEEHIAPLLIDSSITMDMRQEAVDIILDYMIYYKDGSVTDTDQTSDEIPKTGIMPIELYYGMGIALTAMGARIGKRQRSK